MSHYTVNTAPESIAFNFVQSDGKPFNELQYIEDTANAYKSSMAFALRRAAQYEASADYHLDRYHKALAARKQALIDAGELTLALCRARNAYKRIKSGRAK